jgi:hypothetical protein
VLALSPVVAWDSEITIEDDSLRPQSASAITGERVTFVNRSHRLVHLEFGAAAEGHQVFQVPGRIWATFLRPGRHPYVVHFEPAGGELRGVVMAAADDTASGGDPACDGIRFEEVCIEP